MPEGKSVSRTGLEIAVIGMAGRFPGAGDVREFWRNLCAGRESITFFSPEELQRMGLEQTLAQDPDFVPAKGVMADDDCFDAAFFQYSPKEARWLDPQCRVLHECAWNALEDAGCNPANVAHSIGIFVGSSAGSGWETLIQRNSDGNEPLSEFFEKMQYASRDFLATRLAYKLNLRGPAVTLASACSTSLLAIDAACKSLLTGQCRLALAGGATVSQLNRAGYLHQQGMIFSPDGHCRAFDAAAQGTLSSDGVGMVVLKPLESALAEGDHIYAVIRGSAANNDGNRKVGYTAPSVDGQAQVIRAALEMAEVDTETVGYVEAHGTGTALGDPVEIEALKKAFRTEKRGFCRIGAVKTNIGHLDSAAGVAGFIKTVFVLYHQLIPPTLHFTAPNPAIDFSATPFVVNTDLTPWPQDGRPRRAGVSSFGIGGTNVHVVLEEAPPAASLSTPETERLLVLSARTDEALRQRAYDLGAVLQADPAPDLAAVAHTLQTGRRELPCRYALVARRPAEAAEILLQGSAELRCGRAPEERRKIVFLFPGQGAQYVGMGRTLYEREPVFRRELDDCLEILRDLTGEDPYSVVWPADGSSARLDRTVFTQPLVFSFSLALARLLISLGIRPQAMIGHSLGEYTAACLAEVFSREDGLKLVVRRGQLMDRMAAGGMLAVSADAAELAADLPPELSLAADNAPGAVVVAGPHQELARYIARLEERGLRGKMLATSHAFHSAAMDPMLDEFRRLLETIRLAPPRIPYISNLSGSWITPEEAVSPEYWVHHLRRPVRFRQGVQTLAATGRWVWLEAGPGNTLAQFVQKTLPTGSGHFVTHTVRHARVQEEDRSFLLKRLGDLWVNGVTMDWRALAGGTPARVVPLPGYPFERRHFPAPQGGNPAVREPAVPLRNADPADWFYAPSWEQAALPPPPASDGGNPQTWLFFRAPAAPAADVLETLRGRGDEVLRVETDTVYSISPTTEEFRLDAMNEEHLRALFMELRRRDRLPGRIVFFATTPSDPAVAPPAAARAAEERFFFPLLHILRAWGTTAADRRMHLDVVTANLCDVLGGESRDCAPALALGVVKVAPLEYPGLTCRHIDIDAENDSPAAVSAALLQELHQADGTIQAVWRRGRRWLPTIRPLRVEADVQPRFTIRTAGTYLITGGLGGIGLTLALDLAERYRARLVLTGRSPFPAEEEWADWETSHGADDPISRKIAALRRIRAVGGEVVALSADTADVEGMAGVLRLAAARFGTLHGVFHAAAVADYAGVIQRRGAEASRAVLAPKVTGTLVLQHLLADTGLDFMVLFSSAGNQYHETKFGQVAYNAANEFLDACADASACGRIPTLAINWNDWDQVGMSVEAVRHKIQSTAADHDERTAMIMAGALQPAEGTEVCRRVMAAGLPRLIVSTIPYGRMKALLAEWNDASRSTPSATTAEDHEWQPRPALSTVYTAPADETEKRLTEIWCRFFGIAGLGVLDDFFELGGNSLQAMTVIAEIKKACRAAVPMSSFFAAPHIRGVAACIRALKPEESAVIPAAGKREYYPVYPGQKGIFIMQSKDPESIFYNIPAIVELDGEVDPARLESVLQRLIARHAAYRTSFAWRDNEVVQIVHDHAPFTLENRIISEEELSERIAAFFRPFDLGRPPLLRAALFTTPRRTVLAADLHHIVSDGISNTIFCRELLTLYNGEDLPDPPLQFVDFVVWQRERWRSETQYKQKRFWLDAFTGGVPLVQLPVDFPRPALQSFVGDDVEFTIDAELAAAIDRLAADGGATHYMVLLALFNVLLAKYCRQNDIVVATPVAGRPQQELTGVVGMFINVLLMRNRPDPHKRFRDFLAEVKQNTLQSFENQEMPFEYLLQELQVRRDPGRNPLYDVVFAVQNMKMPELRTERLSLRPFIYENKTCKTDLRCGVTIDAAGMTVLLTYSSALFRRDTIETMGRRFLDIARRVCAEPAVCIGDIHLTGTAAAARVRNERNTVEFDL